MIHEGNQEYLRNCKSIKQKTGDLSDIISTENFLKNNKIKCTKFNYTIDKSQSTRCHYAFLQLSKDGERLVITKRIPYKNVQTIQMREFNDNIPIKQLMKQLAEAKSEAEAKRLEKEINERQKDKYQEMEEVGDQN